MPNSVSLDGENTFHPRNDENFLFVKFLCTAARTHDGRVPSPRCPDRSCPFAAEAGGHDVICCHGQAPPPSCVFTFCSMSASPIFWILLPVSPAPSIFLPVYGPCRAHRSKTVSLHLKSSPIAAPWLPVRFPLHGDHRNRLVDSVKYAEQQCLLICSDGDLPDAHKVDCAAEDLYSRRIHQRSRLPGSCSRYFSEVAHWLTSFC